MNRRDAVQRVALLMGGLVSTPSLASILGNQNSEAEKLIALQAFTPKVMNLLGEIAETIIPKTNTPGAKEAGVADFMVTIITDCYTEKERNNFFSGIGNIEYKSQNAYKKSFAELSDAERIEIIKKVEKEAFAQKAKKGADTHPYFLLKDLTMVGYFTSEVGATQALEYVAIPGRYDGCVDLKPGQKAWAT